MLILSKKIERIFILAIATFICFRNVPAQQSTPADASASQPSPPVPAASTVAPSAAVPAPQANADANSATATGLDYLYNHKAQQGTVAKQGMDANEQAKTDALAEDALGNE